MASKETFKLELLYENTFKDNHPNLNQAELEAKYLEEFQDFKKSKKLSHVLAWREFQKERGTLLAPDPKGKWGNGRSLFRASIKSDGKLSVDIAPQVRAWRTKFLTEGSPGTKLALKDTGKQFYDSKTGHALQIHHEKGISEYGPFIDESIRKLLPGNSSRVLNEGLQEYKTFKKWAFDSGRVFGDKVENYTALLKNQHINIPGSVHWLRGPSGPFASVKASGGSAFDDKAKAVRTLKAQTGVSLTPTQDLLNKAYRKGYTKNYDITKPGTIWDEMGTWHDLTDQSTKDATALARQTANPIDGPKKTPKIDEARIKSTNIDDQIPVIKKIAEQYEANEGLSKIDAINKAKIEYNRIRYGDTLARGLDTRKLGLIEKAVETAKKIQEIPGVKPTLEVLDTARRHPVATTLTTIPVLSAFDVADAAESGTALLKDDYSDENEKKNKLQKMSDQYKFTSATTGIASLNPFAAPVAAPTSAVSAAVHLILKNRLHRMDEKEKRIDNFLNPKNFGQTELKHYDPYEGISTL